MTRGRAATLPSEEERFWMRVQKTETCWLWTAGTNGRGYGVFNPTWKGRSHYAHRYSYELTHGPISGGALVCHTCDVRACVRSDHLFLGSAKDNTTDMYAKGRGNTAERNGSAKLTREQVQSIRAERTAKGTTFRRLGEQYGVSYGAARAAAMGLTWHD